MKNYILLNEKLHIATVKGSFLKFYMKKPYQNFTYLKCAGLLTDEMCKKSFFCVYMHMYVSGQIKSRACGLIQFATSVSPTRPSLSCVCQISLQSSLVNFIPACIKCAGETKFCSSEDFPAAQLRWKKG